ncbi:hypothetical protein Tco_0773872 [Tanacetum coccineum]|uniref:Uncharacterized protein n=1 Tax=Tanacetum coccineum TaxID=301880 RepID=A0ABQ4ZNA9_9ASTR
MENMRRGRDTLSLCYIKRIISESREKYDVLFRRIKEVLRAIANVEDSKEVFEAIKYGTEAMKDKMITIEKVQHSFDELDETIDS